MNPPSLPEGSPARTQQPPPSASEFDRYAGIYDHSLGRGLAIAGEDKSFFARGRLSWLAGRPAKMGRTPRAIMEFGCGIGDATPLLFEILGAERTVGIDVSTEALRLAARRYASDRTSFSTPDAYRPIGDVELAVANGVFHHIAPADRSSSLDFVRRSLAPGGLFALFDNNRWHPGARWVISRIPFDRGAIPLSAGEAARRLASAGFEVLGTDYLFVFPRLLARLRPLEPRLSRFSLGAQFLVLARNLGRA